MSTTLIVIVAAGLANLLFWLLVIGGGFAKWRRGGFSSFAGFRRARARAAQRFALGEIDADTYRVLRADLAPGARP